MPSPAVGILVDLSIPKQELPPPSPPRSPPPSDESPTASSPVDARNSPSEAAPPAEDARGALPEEDLLECETFDFACMSPKSLDGSKCCTEDETPGQEVAAAVGQSYSTAVCCTTGNNTPLRKVKPQSPLKPRQMVELFTEATALACHISINYGSAKKEKRMCAVVGGSGSPAVSSPGRRTAPLSRSPMLSPGCRQPRAAGCLPSKGLKEQAWTSMKENIPIHDTLGTKTKAVPKDGYSAACTSMPPPTLPTDLPYDRRRSGRLAARGSQTAAASRRVSLHGSSGDGVAKLAVGNRRCSVGPGRGGALSARGSAGITAAATQRVAAGQLTPRPGSATSAAATGCRSSSSSVESLSATAAAAATAIRSRSMAVRVEATAATVHTRRSLAPQGTAGLHGATKAGAPAARLESATGNGRRVSAVGVRAADTVAVPAAHRRSSAIVGVHQRPPPAPIVAATGVTTADSAVKEQQQPLRAPYELRRSLRAPGAPAARATEPLVKAHGSVAVKSSQQKPASATNGGFSSIKPHGPAMKSSSGAAASMRPAAVPALRPMKAVQPAAATASNASARAGVALAAGNRAAVLPSIASSSRRTSSIGIGRPAIPSTAAAASAAASRALPPTGAAVVTPKNRRSFLPTRLPSSLSVRTQCNGSSEQLSNLIDLGASPVL